MTNLICLSFNVSFFLISQFKCKSVFSLKTIQSHDCRHNELHSEKYFYELGVLNRSKEIFLTSSLFSLRGTNIFSTSCAHTWSTLMLSHDCDMKLFSSEPLTPLVFKVVSSFSFVKKLSNLHSEKENREKKISWNSLSEGTQRPYKGHKTNFENSWLELFVMVQRYKFSRISSCLTWKRTFCTVSSGEIQIAYWDANLHCVQ